MRLNYPPAAIEHKIPAVVIVAQVRAPQQRDIDTPERLRRCRCRANDGRANDGRM
jgi:hypothetical protein